MVSHWEKRNKVFLLTAEKRNSNIGQFLKVKNVGQSESQQMFALSDQGKEEKKLNDWLEL